jgi:hypothetical protein
MGKGVRKMNTVQIMYTHVCITVETVPEIRRGGMESSGRW